MPEKPSEILNQPLTLPCGVTLKNRFGKSAMSENMASADHGPNERFNRLYEAWARGGTGLCVTGNVMINRTTLGEPRNVVVEDDRHMNRLSNWAAAGLWPLIRTCPGKFLPAWITQARSNP